MAGHWRRWKAAAAFAAMLPFAASACAAPARGEDALQKAMLAAHNIERAARGAPPLEWSAELAREAGESARLLAAESDPIAAHHRGGIGKQRGENLWLGTRGAYSFDQMAGYWMAERSLYIDAAVPDISTTGNWSDAGHYAQIIWRGTRRFGCALATGEQQDLLVCRYDPPGNIRGRIATLSP